MTVRQLAETLHYMEPDAIVMVTWEGITRNISDDSIYEANDGTVLIDGDMNHYNERFLSGEKKCFPADDD